MKQSIADYSEKENNEERQRLMKRESQREAPTQTHLIVRVQAGKS